VKTATGNAERDAAAGYELTEKGRAVMARLRERYEITEQGRAALATASHLDGVR